MSNDSSTPRKTVLSAIQPTNQLTLGNYIGAIKNWVGYQDQHDSVFFAVDLHAITMRQDPDELQAQIYRTLATLMAAGLDPERCLMFVQSQVPAHAELAWVLTCHAQMGELSRMTQFKDKSGGRSKSVNVGLFSYPCLMAADILLYHANFVPVGRDQKQHVELTRDIAVRMNGLYGDDLFTLPEPLIPETGARIMSLQDPSRKMSKSDPNPRGAIFLTDSDKQIVEKIKSAVTDSGTEVSYREDKPGVSNLIDIQSALTGRSPEKIVAEYAGKLYGHLKADTAALVVETVAPIREQTIRLMSDRTELDRRIKAGADKARPRANRTLAEVYRRLGFIV